MVGHCFSSKPLHGNYGDDCLKFMADPIRDDIAWMTKVTPMINALLAKQKEQATDDAP